MKKLVAALMCAVLFAMPALAENAASVTIDLQFGSQTYTDEIDVRWNGEAADDMPVFYGTLKEGDTGRCVRELQEMLKKLFFYDGEIDGVFGPETAAAVRAYQRKWSPNGLTENGITDEAFYSSLYYKLSEGATQDVAQEDSFGIVSGERVLLYDSYREERNRIDTFSKGELFFVKQVVYYAGAYWYYVEGAEDGYRHIRGYIQADEFQRITEEQFKTLFDINDQDGCDYKAERKVIGTIQLQEGQRISLYTTTRKDEGRISAGTVKGSATIEVVWWDGYYTCQTKEGYFFGLGLLNFEQKPAQGFVKIMGDGVFLSEYPRSEPSVETKAGDVYPYVEESGEFIHLRNGYWIKQDDCRSYNTVNEWSNIENDDYTFNETISIDNNNMLSSSWIQEVLIALKCYDGEITYNYDTFTEQGVKKFQSDHGLTANGSCDVETKRKLLEAYKAFMAGS